MKISFIILVLFAFIGVMFVGNILHENYHKWDFRDIAKNGSICLLTYPDFEAKYNFKVKSKDEAEVDNRIVRSEIFAYTIDILLSCILVIAIIYQYELNLDMEDV